MNWNFYSMYGLKLLKMLAMMFCLAGCSLTTTTRTKETDARITAGVCTVWKPITYSSKDTPQTQLEVRGNNAAQKAYCLRR